MSVQPCPGGTHTVKSGDTLWTIARAHNASLDAIIRANPGLDPDNLRVGQVICLPPPPPSPTRCGPGLVPYTIQPGDTLYSLQQRGVISSLERTLRDNPGVDPANLRVGQVICVPSAAPAPVPGQCGAGLVPYTIQAGDTLYSLQQRGIIFSLQRTLSDNPGLDPANLRVGQVICVPGATGPSVPSACPAPSRQYVVQSGDTFYSIAGKFGVSVARIEGANPAVNPNNLAIGQIICIPGA